MSLFGTGIKAKKFLCSSPWLATACFDLLAEQKAKGGERAWLVNNVQPGCSFNEHSPRVEISQ
ncbi:MAG: hypothetical protein K6U11_08485 [bacterium]|nr:hypothetical protein [bacterium]